MAFGGLEGGIGACGEQRTALICGSQLHPEAAMDLRRSLYLGKLTRSMESRARASRLCHVEEILLAREK